MFRRNWFKYFFAICLSSALAFCFLFFVLPVIAPSFFIKHFPSLERSVELAITTSDAMLIHEASERLDRSGNAAIELLKSFLSSGEEKRVRFSVCYLAEHPVADLKSSLEDLLLSSPDDDVIVANTAQALARLGPENLPTIENLLNHPNANVSNSILYAVREENSPQAIDFLERNATIGSTEIVRRLAMEHLLRTYCDDEYKNKPTWMFTRFLTSRDPEVAHRAVTCIPTLAGRIGAGERDDILVALDQLETTTDEVKVNIFVAQMELGVSGAVNNLAVSLGTSDQEAVILVDSYTTGMGLGRMPNRGFYKWNSDLSARIREELIAAKQQNDSRKK